MGYLCPECGARGTLRIRESLALPADSRSDEIALQTVACGDCSFTGMAVYEESRRGVLDSECWEHRGFRVPDATFVTRLEAMIRRCPDPSNAACACSVHETLGSTDGAGRWQGGQEFLSGETFPMQLTG